MLLLVLLHRFGKVALHFDAPAETSSRLPESGHTCPYHGRLKTGDKTIAEIRATRNFLVIRVELSAKGAGGTLQASDGDLS